MILRTLLRRLSTPGFFLSFSEVITETALVEWQARNRNLGFRMLQLGHKYDRTVARILEERGSVSIAPGVGEDFSFFGFGGPQTLFS